MSRFDPGTRRPNALPPPSEFNKGSATCEDNYTDSDDDMPASNRGHGSDDALRVTRILEEHGIICCFVGVSALVFYGAARVRQDWEICVPTDLADDAKKLLSSAPYSLEYQVIEPWPYPSRSLAHTWSRFKQRQKDFTFVLVPSRDAHMDCTLSNMTRSLRGLPYPTLAVFIQSSLDMKNAVQLVDVVDGTNVSEEWGEANLQLDGTNDVAWAKDCNQRGEEFADGKYAHWSPFIFDGRKSRREMWQEAVRTKADRLDWTKPSEIFITQYRIVDEPDSWTVLSDMY